MTITAEVLAAAERWERLSDELTAIRTDGIKAETPERMALRAMRLIDRQSEMAHWSRPESIPELGLERVVGLSDFQDIVTLQQGFAVGGCVARLTLDLGGRVIPIGTGFLISPRLLMTNHHVLSSAQWAQGFTAEFNYQIGPERKPLKSFNYRLRPDLFFEFDPTLDFTLVAVDEQSTHGVPLEAWSYAPLRAEEGKIARGEPVVIIQHPRGEYKQIVLRGNRVLGLDADALLYETDTEPGSSGSPVFSPQWEVCALHRRAVPFRQDGHIRRRDGGVWRKGMPESEILWLGNEGTRVSRIVEKLRRAGSRPSSHQRLLDAALSITNPDPFAASRQLEHYMDKRTPSQSAVVSPASSTGSSITVTIPLRITISLGDGGSDTLPRVEIEPSQSVSSKRATPAPAISSRVAAERSIALEESRRARSRPYLDEAAEAAAVTAYYGPLSFTGNAKRRFERLSTLLIDTHRETPRYRPMIEVYPWVDLHEDGDQYVIRSLYSGLPYSVEDFIEQEALIESRREALAMELRSVSQPGISDESLLEELEAQLPFNCEHVVPQSWFGKEEPMRGDLHHLFACESSCNSFRGNIPYHDFPDYREVIRNECGKREANRFEPESGKGPAARAVLYFLLRYPGTIIETDPDVRKVNLENLLAWHEADPPGRYERHRNQAIFERQGNRNPLIDYPKWAVDLDFSTGIG